MDCPKITPAQALERLLAEGFFDHEEWSIEWMDCAPMASEGLVDCSPLAVDRDGNPAWIASGEPGEPIVESTEWIRV